MHNKGFQMNDSPMTEREILANSQPDVAGRTSRHERAKAVIYDAYGHADDIENGYWHEAAGHAAAALIDAGLILDDQKDASADVQSVGVWGRDTPWDLDARDIIVEPPTGRCP